MGIYDSPRIFYGLKEVKVSPNKASLQENSGFDCFQNGIVYIATKTDVRLNMAVDY